jgi:hypothetical protein
VDWPKQIGGLLEVLEREFEEQSLARLAFFDLLANCGVVVVAILDGVIEDRGIRGEALLPRAPGYTGQACRW